MLVDDVLRSKGIDFQPRGGDYLIRCLSPDHEDRNPSLRVDKVTGIFNCLSCGYKGSIFEHFGEKADWLQIRRKKLTSLIDEKLKESTGYRVPETAVPFDRDWRGISAKTLLKFGAFQHNNPEFIGRVVFPVYSISGKIVSFCGRHLSQGDPKYLFHPAGASLPFFPIVKPIQGSIILVEGIIDMLNLHDKGLTNAVCAFGVNKMNEEKLNILKIQGVSCIDIFFDDDTAGKLGTDKLIKFLEEREVSHRAINHPDVDDPGEMTASQVIELKEMLYG